MNEKTFLDGYHECARCSKKYRMIENIGKYNCLQHTGYVNSKGYFSCCGVHANDARDTEDYYTSGKCRGTSEDLGCNPCSHVSKYAERGTYVYDKRNGYFKFYKTTIDIFGKEFNPEEKILTTTKDVNKVYRYVKMFETPPPPSPQSKNKNKLK